MLSVTLYSTSAAAEYVRTYTCIYVCTSYIHSIHSFHGSVSVIKAVGCGTSHKCTKYTNLQCKILEHFTETVL